MQYRAFVVPALGVTLVASPVLASDPWADQVISYTQGSGVAAGYNQPGNALGQPTRFTGVGSFPGAVTPFNPAFLGSELVSIGAGGSLTVRFDEPVSNDAANPFGIDLLIFGNAGYIDTNFPAGVAGPLFGAGGGMVEVSADGSTWVTATGALADGPFPTLGYLDLTDPYATAPGAIPSDFTRPVNPAFNPAGLAFSQIVAGFAGSGGGAGIDIGALGLSSISFVRITNPIGAAMTVDIDALSDVSAVPAPAGLLALCSGFRFRRRRP